MNRFSPYFEQWREWGFPEPKPDSEYQWTLTGLPIDLDTFAYKFSGQHPSTLSPALEGARQRLADAVELWKANYETDTFFYWVGDSRIVLAREGSRPLHLTLQGEQAKLFLACDSIRRVESLEREFPTATMDIRGQLAEWQERGIIAMSIDWQQAIVLPIRRQRLRPSSLKQSTREQNTSLFPMLDT